MALIQMEKRVANQPDMTADEAVQLYDEKIAETKALMENKKSRLWRGLARYAS